MSTIDWWLRTGRLRAVLPGVYADPAASGPAVDLLAAGLWRPDAVLTGAAAAKLTFWPDVRLTGVDLASPRSRPETRGRFHLERRGVPPEFVRTVGPLRVTDPALTALDLCSVFGGDGIDAALRSRTATLDRMWEAYRTCGKRRGNHDRRALLLDSRNEPWSAAERLLHRLLRAARITGWRSNYRVHLRGNTYFIDVAFPGLKIAIEVDGRSSHGPDQFESDRERQNTLVLTGWTVLRFTWAMLNEQPEEVIAAIGAVLASRP